MYFRRLPQVVAPVVMVALALLSIAPPFAHSSISPAPAGRPGALTRSDISGSLSLLFVENRGQTAPQVAFTLLGGEDQAFFTPDGVTYALVEAPQNSEQAGERWNEAGVRLESEPAEPGRRWAVKLDFPGGRHDVQPVGEELAETVVSYFRGRPDQWHTGLRTFRRIVYHDLWPGIDLAYSGTNGVLKYEFVVHPGADPGQIRLAYRGADSVELGTDGQLAVSTPAGQFVDGTPLTWQELSGGRRYIPARFEIEARPDAAEIGTSPAGPDRVSYRFNVGSYDPAQTLVIDPAVFGFCGYIGGNAEDRASSMAVDAAGNAYITGKTASGETTFPVAAGPDLSYNGSYYDAFVTKVDASGRNLVYAGYIGGSSADYGNGITVDAEGSAYVTGETGSSEATFPSIIGPDLTFNGYSDGFVAKVNPSGTGLVYAGYLGGSDFDSGNGITVDAAGNAYVGGWTQSENFPVVVGPGHWKGWSAGDGFVTKLNPTGTALIYSGYTGIDGYDALGAIAVDEDGSAYIAGTVGAYGYPHGTVTKVDPTGRSFVYMYTVGGIGRVSGVAVDKEGSAYATGLILSFAEYFPAAVGPDLTYNGSADAYVLKLNPAGNALVYAGWIGGAANDFGNALTVDPEGSAYVVGSTESDEKSFPALDGPDLTHNGGTDGFIVKVDPSGSGLTSASFLGGTGGEDIGGVAIGPGGDIYVAGYTSSDEGTFPAVHGPHVTYNKGDDAFVAKITAATKVDAVHAQVRPAVDGNLVEWMGLGDTPFNHDNSATITGLEPNPSRADLSGTFRMAWASDRLYLAAQFRDDVLVGNNSPQVWGDDSVELGIEAVGSFHQFTFGLDGRQADGGSPISSLTVATRTVSGGWTLEASIPASALGVTALKAGRTYRFTVGYWDDDLFSYPGQTHMIWRGTSTFTNQPEFWAAMELTSRDYDFPQIARTQTPTPTNTPTNTPSPTATSTATPLETPSATPTKTASPSPGPTDTLTPPAEPSLTPTATGTRAPILYLPLIVREG